MQKIIKGTLVSMGGENFTIPALTLGAIRALQPEVEALSDPLTPQNVRFESMSTVIHTAMLRNYPDLTLERLTEELLDMSNIGQVTQAVMGVSGFVDKAPGEAPGVSLPIGTPSTPA